METRPINPHTWLGAWNLHQAIEVTGGQRVLYVSGQTSHDANGAPLHPGDLVAQVKEAWANLAEVLETAGMKPANVVRLNFYTTDVDLFMTNAGDIVPIYAAAGCKPTATLLGVTRLFDPGAMIEIEATAVA